ncbi:MAG: hypothetical protein AAGI49_06105, partial [Bacteroidota bacterium]
MKKTLILFFWAIYLIPSVIFAADPEVSISKVSEDLCTMVGIYTIELTTVTTVTVSLENGTIVSTAFNFPISSNPTLGNTVLEIPDPDNENDQNRFDYNRTLTLEVQWSEIIGSITVRASRERWPFNLFGVPGDADSNLEFATALYDFRGLEAQIAGPTGLKCFSETGSTLFYSSKKEADSYLWEAKILAPGAQLTVQSPNARSTQISGFQDNTSYEIKLSTLCDGQIVDTEVKTLVIKDHEFCIEKSNPCDQDFSNYNNSTTAPFTPTANDDGTSTFKTFNNLDFFNLTSKDADGNVVWEQTGFGDNTGYLNIQSNAIDHNANSIVNTGYFVAQLAPPNPSTRRDVFVLKNDSTGNISWNKTFTGTEDDVAKDVVVGANGHVGITGYFNGTIAFDNNTLTSSNTTGTTLGYDINLGGDIFVTQLNNNGDVLWAKQISSASRIDGLSIDMDSQGNTYVTGKIQGTTEFDFITKSIPSNAVKYFFIAKYNPAGQIQWVKTGHGLGASFTGYSDSELKVDQDDNVIVVVNADNGFKLYEDNISMTASNEGTFVIKYESDGAVAWTNQIGNATDFRAGGFTVDQASNIIIGGQFSGTASFDNGNSLASNGGTDLFFTKIDKNGNMRYTEQSGGTSDESISGLSGDGFGAYSYTGKGDNGEGGGCVDGDFSDSTACQISVEPIVTHATCGGSDGAIEVVVDGGFPPYTYEWSNGSASPIINGLDTGYYSLIVRDTAGCVGGTLVRIVGSIDENDITVTPSITNSACADSTGSITVAVTGSTGPYTYEWSNGDDGITADSLKAGFYTIAITDASECVFTATYELKDAGAPTLSFATTNTISNKHNGAIDMTITGGAAPFTIDWSNDGFGDADDSEDLSGLFAGQYFVAVEDNNGCVVYGTVEIFGSMELSLTAYEPGCAGASGAIHARVIGGNAPYTFAWRLQGGTWSDAVSNSNRYEITGLSAGTYEVQVTDVDGILINAGTTISSGTNNFQIASAQTGDVFCATDGEIAITLSGGIPPYIYTNTTTGDIYTTDSPFYIFSGLALDSYSISVEDANACTASTTVQITGNSNTFVIDEIESIGSACPSGQGGTNSKGSIIIDLSGGVAPYSYSWKNLDGADEGNATSSLSNYAILGLSAGLYRIEVVDDNGCMVENLVTIESSSDCTPVDDDLDDDTQTCTNVVISSPVVGSCTSGNNGGINHACSGGGTIGISVSGGNPPYNYIWLRNNQYFSNSNALSTSQAGSYKVIVQDQDGCTAEAGSWNIYDPLSLSMGCSVSIQNSSNFDVQAMISGGSQCKQFTWYDSNNNVIANGNNVQSTIKNISAGSYSILVEDVRTGCSVSGGISVSSSSCGGGSSIITGDDETSLEVRKSKVQFEVAVSPNPFNKYINLSIQSSIEQHIEVKLFDLVGKLVHQQQLLVGTGANNIA